MRKILSFAAALAMMALGWSAQASTPAHKKAPKKSATAKSASKAPRKKTAAAKKPGARRTVARKTRSHKAVSSKRSSSRTASRRRSKKAPVRRTTWRNRQTQPTPERYKEIQDALAAKGYLKPEDAGGTWNQASIDALKKFQSDQNLVASGKINSLSLIALGLGPKRETAAANPPQP